MLSPEVRRLSSLAWGVGEELAGSSLLLRQEEWPQIHLALCL